MRNRRVIINVLVIMAALALFAFWYNFYIKPAALPSLHEKEQRHSDIAVTNTNYKMFLITDDKQAQFWKDMNQGASNMAQLLGLNYTWEAPATRDGTAQAAVLKQAIENGADAIIISAIDPEQLSGPIREAVQKGVKIVYVENPAKEEGIIVLATDNYGAGAASALSMLEELEISGLKQGQIGILSSDGSNQSILERNRGFLDAIKADGRFTALEPIYVQGDMNAAAGVTQAAKSLIESNPSLVGMFGSDEQAGIGVGNAIKSENDRIVGIAFDKSSDAMKLLEEGSLRAVIAQNPYTMGYLGMAEAFAALNGLDTGPPYLNTGVSVITKR